jgi:uncharacterized protein YjeT (DUF2065 family)
MWQDILTAFSLYLIIEGMILRATGLTIMATGLLLLFVVR